MRPSSSLSQNGTLLNMQRRAELEHFDWHLINAKMRHDKRLKQ